MRDPRSGQSPPAGDRNTLRDDKTKIFRAIRLLHPGSVSSCCAKVLRALRCLIDHDEEGSMEPKQGEG